jgi:hypothetical protein
VEIPGHSLQLGTVWIARGRKAISSPASPLEVVVICFSQAMEKAVIIEGKELGFGFTSVKKIILKLYGWICLRANANHACRSMVNFPNHYRFF